MTEVLYIHPTVLALRQLERRALQREGFFDGRRHLTLRAFTTACAEAAAWAGLLRGANGRALRPITDLEHELAVVEAAGRFAREAGGSGSTLAALGPTGLQETLAQFVELLAPLAERAEDFLRLLETDGVAKNRDLAALYRTYAGVCAELGVADEVRQNSAVLGLLRGPRHQWPVVLRRAGKLVFAAVRWIPPFVEAMLRELERQLGRDRVQVRHLLPEHEQEWWGGALLTRTGQLLFGSEAEAADGREFHAAETRATIDQLSSLREGLAMQDRQLAESARTRVGFSCSVGVYGEVEDLARRIAWELYDRPDPVAPEDIALVVRDLGVYADAVTDVFRRFRIPFHFRRGEPALAVPVVKTMLNLVELSATRRRDVFCALLRSPWLDWGPKLDPAALADAILRSGVEPVMPDPAALETRLATWYGERGVSNPAQRARAGRQAFAFAVGAEQVDSLAAAVADLLARVERLRLPQQVAAGPAAAPHNAALPAADRRAWWLNARAFEAVLELCQTLRRLAWAGLERPRLPTWEAVLSVLTRALRNLTIPPAPADEAGVWVINPYDAAGLKFRVVLIAGLNAGAFPRPPVPSPLFSDNELLALRERLARTGFLPAAALAASRARMSQENLLFLTTLAAAEERLIFSYVGHDESGQELTPSVFFSTVWRLAGWPAYETLPAEPPDPYDQWRLQRAPGHFLAHWQRHRAPGGASAAPAIPPHKRKPFAGESYLATVPLPLCRAADEWRQRRACAPGEHLPGACRTAGAVDSIAEGVAHALRVEAERRAFFEAQAAPADPAAPPPPADTLPGHTHAGVIAADVWQDLRPAARDGVWDFSPSDLERLVVCPYRYYLERLLRIEPLEPTAVEVGARDFGSAVHTVMYAGLRLLQDQPVANLPASVLAQVQPLLRELARPAWAVRDRSGEWRLCLEPTRPARKAWPLARLDPERKDELVRFLETLASSLLRHWTQGHTDWQLGAPEQWPLVERRLCRAVRNLLLASLDENALPALAGAGDTETGRTLRRYPALLEFTFDSRRPDAARPSVELADPQQRDRRVRMHGKVDRVDLLFDAATGQMVAAIVMDYKASLRERDRPLKLARAIAQAHDCQLPAYGLAARAALAGNQETKAPVPVLMQYVAYGAARQELVRQMGQTWLTLEGQPLADEELVELCGGEGSLLAAFTVRVLAAVERFARGEFAVKPEECQYCAAAACCRYAVASLPAEAAGEDGTV